MRPTCSHRPPASRWQSLRVGLWIGAVMATGCLAVAGLDDDYVLGSSDGSGAGATAGHGGSGAAGATGGSSTSTGGSTTTTSSTGGGTTTTSGNGGSGGQGGDPEVLKQVVESLHGLRIEFPCQDQGDPYCATAGIVTDSRISAGAPGATYDVSVRIQGVTEMETYQGGTPSGQLYIGGQPLGGWNIYGLQVTDPPQTYWVNNGPCCNPWCEEIDIQTTIQVATGATVTLLGDDRNFLSTRNMDQNGTPIVINGVPSAPNDGQFVQLSAQDATPVP